MYKIPEIKNIDIKILNIKTLNLAITLSIQESSNAEYFINKYLKQFEGRMTPVGYIVKFIKIIDIGLGYVDKYKYDPSTTYNVIFEAYLFDPLPEDILVGCRVKLIIDERIQLSYRNHISIIIKNNGKLKINDLVNIRIIATDFNLDKLKYKIQYNLRVGSRNIFKTLDIRNYVKKSKNTIEFYNHEDKLIKINSLINCIPNNQCVIFGELINFWDIPVDMRYIKLNFKEKIKLNITFDDNISIILNKKYSSSIFKKMKNYLLDKKWGKLKTFINPYEKLTRKKKVISRAFFKIWEIIKVFKFNNINNALTLGDAPGGFTQAINILFPKSKIKTISLKDSPIKYDKIIKEQKNVFIDDLAEKDGNLLSIKNINYLINLNEKYDFIAGDASLKYDEPISKEIQHFKLLFIELFIAISLLKIGGSCAVKCYERETKPTLQLIYWLSYFFENTYIIKPQSSRIANAEVYIVGKKLKYNIENNNYISTILTNKKYISSLFDEIKNYKNIIYHTYALNRIRLFSYNYAYILNKRKLFLSMKKIFDEDKEKFADEKFSNYIIK
jgi:23S rRNA U2552 (ribose-2'-O)-methylase RlmE/FtsJ/DNA-directed RNA polymerase subunit E'/Rpb7